MRSSSLSQYIELITSFLHDRIPASGFEHAYLDLYLNDKTKWSEVEFSILDELFGDVDAFCADVRLRDPDDLDENQLKQRCKIALDKLSTIITRQYGKSESDLCRDFIG